nr:hypothetical protein ICEMyc226_00204 [Mycolicibacterium sp.]
MARIAGVAGLHLTSSLRIGGVIESLPENTVLQLNSSVVPVAEDQPHGAVGLFLASGGKASALECPVVAVLRRGVIRAGSCHEVRQGVRVWVPNFQPAGSFGTNWTVVMFAGWKITRLLISSINSWANGRLSGNSKVKSSGRKVSRVSRYLGPGTQRSSASLIRVCRFSEECELQMSWAALSRPPSIVPRPVPR